MKVFLHYEDIGDTSLHKSLKLTLPKSWKTGPSSNLLTQFVESYNAKFQESNPLNEKSMHLCIRQASDQSDRTKLFPLCSDDVVVDEIPDRGDVYICHGPSISKSEKLAKEKSLQEERERLLKETVACTHFGCRNRFKKGGPYPDCQYHTLPPVFHETAKYWACCPNKKAYDWDDFQNIPGCQKGKCTEIKEEGQKQFLGGTDLRDKGESTKLKSIDDFNRAQAGGGESAPVLDRLQEIMTELGIEKELFDQVINGMKQELKSKNISDPDSLEAIATDLGSKIKAMMKTIAAEQLRIKD